MLCKFQMFCPLNGLIEQKNFVFDFANYIYINNLYNFIIWNKSNIAGTIFLQ